MYSLPSRPQAIRDGPLTPVPALKMSVSPVIADPSRRPRATVKTDCLSPAPGFRYVRYTSWLLANCGCSTTSISPERPCGRTAGVPPMGFGSSTPLRTTRSRPSLSVTRRLPSGRNARLHGFTRPRAIGTTRIRMTSAVSYSIGSDGIGWGSNPGRCDRLVPFEGDGLLSHAGRGGGQCAGGDKTGERWSIA